MMKHDLTKYKVPCPDKKAGKTFKRILKYLGEPIADWYDFDFESFPHQEISLWTDSTKEWRLGISILDKEISIKELIKMILENQEEESAEKRIKENNEPEYVELIKDDTTYYIYKNGDIFIKSLLCKTKWSFTINKIEEFTKAYHATFKSNT